MENRKVGYLIIAIAALIGFIVYSFNATLAGIVATSCSHGSECPMYGNLNFQTNTSLGIIFFIMVVGLYLVFYGNDDAARALPNKNSFDRESYSDDLEKLSTSERKVFELVLDDKGSIFQSSIVEKTGMTKVKISRVLDRLEGKGLIERKRRGMTNVVVLRH